MVLVEAMMALSILTVLGLVLLKLSLNILHPRQWVLQQTVTDAYLTYERAYAERIPFETLLAERLALAGLSRPPAPPTVEIGRLPGNRPITGTVTRTRFADSGNYPIDGGIGHRGHQSRGDEGVEGPERADLQIGDRSYAKSRTVLRSQ